MMWILLILVPLLIVLYLRWTRRLLYWKNRGVEGPKPLPLVGNMLDQVLDKKSFGDLTVEWAKRSGYKVPFLGVYNFMTPTLILYDPKYLESVLTKNFSYFADRFPVQKNKHNIFDQTLFNFTGAKWKAFRSKLSPVFTSGKLKGMVPEMKKAFHNCFKFIENNESRTVEARCVAEIYSVDVIASIAFGIESAEMSCPDSEFTRVARSMFKFTWKVFLSFIINTYFPRVSDLFRIPTVANKYADYLRTIVEETFNQRKTSGVTRNDFIQLLLELKEKGRVDVKTWHPEDDYLKDAGDQLSIETIEMTDELLVAQAVIFLTTGFETSSNTMIFTIIHLAQNPRAMEKLVDEVDRVMAVHKDYTHEALKDMQYLEKCILESLRLHPAVQVISRICTRDFTFDCGLRVDKGTFIGIPVLAVHTNPNIYPDPLKYHPDRFDTPPSPGTYFGFGEGPRICIAKRFAMLELKMLLAKLFYTYHVCLNSQTVLPPTIEKRNVITKLASPVYLDLKKRVHPVVQITIN